MSTSMEGRLTTLDTITYKDEDSGEQIVMGRAHYIITGPLDRVRLLAKMFMEPLAVGLAQEANGSPLLGVAVDRPGLRESKRVIKVEFPEEDPTPSSTPPTPTSP